MRVAGTSRVAATSRIAMVQPGLAQRVRGCLGLLASLVALALDALRLALVLLLQLTQRRLGLFGAADGFALGRALGLDRAAGAIRVPVRRVVRVLAGDAFGFDALGLGAVGCVAGLLRLARGALLGRLVAAGQRRDDAAGRHVQQRRHVEPAVRDLDEVGGVVAVWHFALLELR